VKSLKERKDKMKACVDKTACIGCGLCASIAPDIFEIEDDGLAGVIGELTSANEAEAKDAEMSCPVAAIKVE
jgi:ferredoxin